MALCLVRKLNFKSQLLLVEVAVHQLTLANSTVSIFLLFLQVEETNFEVDAEIKDWSCKRCTLENPGDMSICQACGGSKLKSLEPNLSKKDHHWTCPKCTLRNPYSALKCRVCESSRKLPRLNSKCSLCTYENAPGKKKCDMCSANLKSVSQDGSKTNSINSKITINTETSRPGSTTSMGSRHESELMEQLRKVEESAAKDKWRNIVHFCREVLVLALIMI